jgi:hypothetical protein
MPSINYFCLTTNTLKSYVKAELELDTFSFNCDSWPHTKSLVNASLTHYAFVYGGGGGGGGHPLRSWLDSRASLLA